MASTAEIARAPSTEDCYADKHSPGSTCSTVDSVDCSWSLVDFEEHGSRFPEVQDAVLQRLCDVYTALSTRKCPGGRLTAFHATHEPGMKIAAYFKRICALFKNSASSSLVAFIYMDRLLNLDADLISGLSIHRFLAVAMVVSTKFTDDICYSNAHYAKVCGLSLQELNRLEMRFLGMLHWKVSVDANQIEAYLKLLANMPNSVA
eukprot:TRINITY_DN22389_c0_g1_i1.p1 TRINITY_DN22389_c0_g1~~TRINITY_DN22389_c0_g1_i1.p1  ORF type:complete len:205 (+),score=37.81 TRINITY_DN22389_c0_g1_i1:103-717(+)